MTLEIPSQTSVLDHSDQFPSEGAIGLDEEQKLRTGPNEVKLGNETQELGPVLNFWRSFGVQMTRDRIRGCQNR